LGLYTTHASCQRRCTAPGMGEREVGGEGRKGGRWASTDRLSGALGRCPRHIPKGSGIHLQKVANGGRGREAQVRDLSTGHGRQVLLACSKFARRSRLESGRTARDTRRAEPDGGAEGWKRLGRARALSYRPVTHLLFVNVAPEASDRPILAVLHRGGSFALPAHVVGRLAAPCPVQISAPYAEPSRWRGGDGGGPPTPLKTAEFGPVCVEPRRLGKYRYFHQGDLIRVSPN